MAHEACRLIGEWRARGLAAVPLAINVSAEQFNAEHWLPAFSAQLQSAKIDPAA